MRVLVPAVASVVGSVAFQMSVEAGYIRHFTGAVPWLWGGSAALWAAWIITHDKVVKQWLKTVHEKLGRGVYAVRVIICLIVFFAVSATVGHWTTKNAEAQSSGAVPQSTPPPNANQPSSTTPPTAKKTQSVKVKGDNDNAGNIDQSGNGNGSRTAVIGSNNSNIGNTVIDQSPKNTGWLVPADDSVTTACLNQPVIPNDPMPDTTPPDGVVAVFLGDSRFLSSSFPYSPLVYKQQRVFTIERDDEKRVSITIDVRSKDGKVVARIQRGKFVVNQNNILSMETPDKSTLVVTDQDGNEVLNVRYRNRSVIHFTGTLYLNGRSEPVVIADDGITASPSHYGSVCETYSPRGTATLFIH